MTKVTAALAAVLLVLVMSGCDGGVPGPGESNVDVDTPALREQKAAAGIEDCVPGDSSNDLPDLTLACLGGGPEVDLSSLQGPMLINLWYSGCGPCRQEMPDLQEFHDTHGEQVPVLGVDIETYPDYAIGFADEVDATYPQVADPGGTIFEQDGLRLVSAYPQTIFLRADGSYEVRAVPFKSVGEIEQAVEDVLGVGL